MRLAPLIFPCSIIIKENNITKYNIDLDCEPERVAYGGFEVFCVWIADLGTRMSFPGHGPSFFLGSSTSPEKLCESSFRDQILTAMRSLNLEVDENQGLVEEESPPVQKLGWPVATL